MSKSISINVSNEEQYALDTLLSLVPPLINRHALARLALRVGIHALREHPERVPGLLAGQRLRFTPTVP